MASNGVLVEPDQRDKLAATISCNSTKIYRIINYNKSIATGQISQSSLVYETPTEWEEDLLAWVTAATAVGLPGNCTITCYVGTVYVLKLLVVTSSPSCKRTQKKNCTESSTSGRVQYVKWQYFCLQRRSGMFPDTSSYANLIVLVPTTSPQSL